MGLIKKKTARALCLAALVLAAASLVLPAIALADSAAQTVNSGWCEVMKDNDEGGYGWKLYATLTVENGTVSDVVINARGDNRPEVPETERPYYDSCHIIMEGYIIDAAIVATDIDAVDSVDTVSGATHTSIAIKKAVKDALTKWNADRAEAAGETIAAIAALKECATAKDLEAAVQAAEDALEGLTDAQRAYVLPSEAEAIQDAKNVLATDKDLANAKVACSFAKATYTGKALTPAVTVTSMLGTRLVPGKDYALSYKNNVNVGTASVEVSAAVGGAYKGSKTGSFTIVPAPQTIKAAKTYKVKAKKAKKKAQKIAVKFTANGGGKVTYTAAKSGKVSIAKNGKVTVKKGTKKGTYTLKVKVTAAAVGNYAQTTSVVPLKIKVA